MAGSVRGYVLTTRGRPVAEASVVVASGPGPFPDIAAVSDDDGSFVLDGFTPGTYILRAFAPDGGSGEGSVAVYGKGVATVRIVLGEAESANGSVW